MINYQNVLNKKLEDIYQHNKYNGEEDNMILIIKVISYYLFPFVIFNYIIPYYLNINILSIFINGSNSFTLKIIASFFISSLFIFIFFKLSLKKWNNFRVDCEDNSIFVQKGYDPIFFEKRIQYSNEHMKSLFSYAKLNNLNYSILMNMEEGKKGLFYLKGGKISNLYGAAVYIYELGGGVKKYFYENGIFLYADGDIIDHDLNMSNFYIQKMANNLTINGNLYLNDSNIIELPDNLTVNGNLYLNHKTVYTERQLSTLNVRDCIFIEGIFTDKNILIAKFRDKSKVILNNNN